MKFSQRTGWPTSPNSLSELLASKTAGGAQIIDLTESNPTAVRFNYIRSDLLEPLTSNAGLTYQPDPKGLIGAREAICDYYREKQLELNPDQIILTASTSEAYLILFRLLVNCGEQVAVTSPRYPLLDFLAELSDVSLVQFRTVRSGGNWRIDIESLSCATLDSVRAFAVVHPNNPTGNYFSSDERIALNDICRKIDAALIVDEVFFDYPLFANNSGHTSFVANNNVLTFTINGISKILGLPQMKIAWIVVTGPPHQCSEAIARLEVIADTLLSVNTPGQNALGPWIARRKEIQGEISSRLCANANFVKRTLSTVEGVDVLIPEGGWYVTILSGYNDEVLSLSLLADGNVLVSPGYLYEFELDNAIVISLLPEEAEFQHGVEVIKRVLQGAQ